MLSETMSIASLTRPARGDSMCFMGTATIPAGKTLKIETSPKGEELYEYEVPAGKVMTVKLRLEYALEDA